MERTDASFEAPVVEPFVVVPELAESSGSDANHEASASAAACSACMSPAACARATASP